MRGLKRSAGLVGVALIAVAIVPLATAATSSPETGKWVGHSTNGDVAKGKKGEATFRVALHPRRLQGFKIPEAGGYCYTGYEAITIAVPRARIVNGTVNTRYAILNHPADAKPTVHLWGHFTAARTFKGEVKGLHYCDYDIKFVAHPAP